MTSFAEAVMNADVREVFGDSQVTVTGVQHDSRQIGEGDVFVAVPGQRADGAVFVEEARRRGAVAVIAERRLAVDLPQAIVVNVRQAIALAAAQVYGDPSRRLKAVGVTGTNGKTTTVQLIAAALRQAGERPALLGTLGFELPEAAHGRSAVGGVEAPSWASHTTPEGDDLARLTRQAVDAAATHLVMEVSSHALALHRVDGTAFELAAFSNLTQDHLDFHGSFAAYGAAKARLFRELAPKFAVLNVDDDFVAALRDELVSRQPCGVPSQVWACTMQRHREAEVRVVEHHSDRHGMRLHIDSPVGELRIESPLVGQHNAENLLLAGACALRLQAPSEAVGRGLSRVEAIDGRLQRIVAPDQEPSRVDIAVFVDFAHTPDALRRVLETLRPLTPGRLIVVFGCGGDRDKDKRPRMGQIAAQLAQVVVLTNDNPRSEPPSSILQAIAAGVIAEGLARLEQPVGAEARGWLLMEDRRRAIQAAIAMACPGDTVLIAGKGHETIQIVAGERLPFDDRIEAYRALESRS